VGVEIVMLAFLVYFKPLADAFGHLQMPVIFWAWLGLYALIIYALDWIRKIIFRSFSVSKLVKSHSHEATTSVGTSGKP
jgi:hypothetical protein